jgi:hypothetical protein
MRCEYHFVHQYCDPAANEPPSRAGAAGTAFHAYRAAYVKHLVTERKWQDTEWAYEYVDAHSIPEEARLLVERDMMSFAINPESVFGSEVFMSIDKDFRPLEMEFDVAQGSRGNSPHSILSGTVDLLIVEQGEARVIDAKSAYSATTISEEEAAIYCCLIFSHFPQITSVDFAWDFVRLGAHKSSRYGREELPAMEQLIRDMLEFRRQVMLRVSDGDKLNVNPWSGMCPFCSLLCPALQNIEKDTPARIYPLQDVANARRLAGMIYLCDQFLHNARPLLKEFVQAREDLPNGQLQLGANFVAELTTSTSRKLPVLDVLNSIGLGVVNMTGLDETQTKELLEMQPAFSPKFDVPLRNLELRGSALKAFAKTKRSKKRPDGGGVSREGLSGELELISPLIADRTVLRIRRVDQAIAESSSEESEQ